ncbi:rhodanese-related sulfurtransferase [Cerasibacillus quisquiliarum]|uniref:Rhodanese domain-containing protein n=1 Tax=Cerasibacillus quisquiliarum TaxID=227865 RepID=A0A511V1F1_9BACI|nr:rhodanese-like domain-containing protein [Cerasibacillus quisquiliarum]MBB5146939.1 rhodanese-related sulfurtransferase [Cerasibacillus quisquiliarum]GEN31738.1 hypothetical protein CQU01_19760 [Cerasibacillus quisquiliarum]
MEYILLSLMLIIILSIYYKRYVPVPGVKRLEKMPGDDVTLIDVRDYNDIVYDHNSQIIHIPIPYLGRNYQQIPTKKVAIIASDRISRNVSIRDLKKYNFHVVGYYCVPEKETITSQVAPSTCI